MLLILVAGHWSVSCVCAIISIVLQVFLSINTNFNFTFFLFLILDFIVLILGMATYIYFYLTVKRLRKLQANVGTHQENGTSLLIKKFKLPCYFVLTYIFFNITSTIMLTLSRNIKNESQAALLKHFSYIPIVVGFVSDILIYTFGNRNVRGHVHSMFSKKRVFVPNRFSDFETNQPSDG